MTAFQISINCSPPNILCDDLSRKGSCVGLKLQQPISFYSLSRRKIVYFAEDGFKSRVLVERNPFLGGRRRNDEIGRSRERVVVVKSNRGFGFNGGGGGRDNSNSARLLGNLAFAIGLTYLSMTGQLGWVLDAIVSIWVLAVIVPIVGLGAFLWWAGRDIIQGTCPNCGNDFQIFKSSLNDGLQLCPFCGQPFSVEGDEFIKESVKFSNQSKAFSQAFSRFSPRSKEGKDSSVKVVDVEAEIKDVD